jgi:hypothetical protein
MRKSETIGSLAKALSAAQADMGPARKGADNPYFESTYADLSSVTDAIREPLASHGIAYVQTIEPGEEGFVNIHTSLIHESGEWIESVLPIRPVKTNPQGIGSAISYGKRYGLQAIVCLPSSDDDAEGAMGRPKPQSPRMAPAKPQDVAPVSEAQLKKLHTVAGQLNLDRDALLKGCSAHIGRVIQSTKDLTKAEAVKVIDAMEKKAGVA